MTRVLELDDPEVSKKRLLRWHGNPKASVLVVTDAPAVDTYAARPQRAMSGQEEALFGGLARHHGFDKDDFFFLTPCPPIPDVDQDSESRKAKFIEPYAETVRGAIRSMAPRCVLYMGNVAGRQVLGRPVKITKARGVAHKYTDEPADDCMVLGTFSAGYCLRYPEHQPVLDADLGALARLRRADWDIGGADGFSIEDAEYEWCTDLREHFGDAMDEFPYDLLAVDTETTGLDFYRPEVRVLTVQLSWIEGRGIMCPIHPGYWRAWRRDFSGLRRLRSQLKTILENPNIRKVGHNIKFEHHMLREEGIDVRGWKDDTQLLAFFVDENMMEKSLDECVRRWVPEMSGYADSFNRTYDKSKMIEVPHADMLPYGCGDGDSTLRLCRRLRPLLEEDDRQRQCYEALTLPALVTFARSVEPHGMRVDSEALAGLKEQLDEETERQYEDLIGQVPASIRREHSSKKKGLNFGRAAFLIDILFAHEDGLRLIPRVWTKTTRRLPEAQRVPSVSAKEHLPFFGDVPFVAQLIEFQKLQKMRSTYVGDPDGPKGPTGFWKYIVDDYIHPSYMLHRVVTGRSSSANPNGQNIPKRGPLADAFRRVFTCTDGYVLGEADLSQIELRLVAWTANEPTMLEVYRQGGDIHATTAAATMGITDEQFRALPEDVFKLKRYQAKAVNFGYVYGMGWRRFRSYAKTDYGIDLSEGEAQAFRDTYFELYGGLEGWHRAMRAFVHQHGYVRAIHGALRHLPSIRSIDESIIGEAERQAINSPIQRFASDLGLLAMARFARDADSDLFRIVGFIHDSLVVECRRDVWEEGMAALRWYMENPPLRQWFGINTVVPIVADVSVSDGERPTLADMREVEVPARRPSWYGSGELLDRAA